MRARITDPPPAARAFERFSIVIDVEDVDQLFALTQAVARIGNGHGLELYDLLKAKCDQNGISGFPPNAKS